MRGLDDGVGGLLEHLGPAPAPSRTSSPRADVVATLVGQFRPASRFLTAAAEELFYLQRCLHANRIPVGFEPDASEGMNPARNVESAKLVDPVLPFGADGEQHRPAEATASRRSRTSFCNCCRWRRRSSSACAGAGSSGFCSAGSSAIHYVGGYRVRAERAQRKRIAAPLSASLPLAFAAAEPVQKTSPATALAGYSADTTLPTACIGDRGEDVGGGWAAARPRRATLARGARSGRSPQAAHSPRDLRRAYRRACLTIRRIGGRYRRRSIDIPAVVGARKVRAECYRYR